RNGHSPARRQPAVGRGSPAVDAVAVVPGAGGVSQARRAERQPAAYRQVPLFFVRLLSTHEAVEDAQVSQELVYTSAPQGLKVGSRGFCTVASTAGMPAALAERLESLSGYRHVFPPQDPQARNNPVAWSHLIVSLGGKCYHVVSRVA